MYSDPKTVRTIDVCSAFPGRHRTQIHHLGKLYRMCQHRAEGKNHGQKQRIFNKDISPCNLPVTPAAVRKNGYTDNIDRQIDTRKRRLILFYVVYVKCTEKIPDNIFCHKCSLLSMPVCMKIHQLLNRRTGYGKAPVIMIETTVCD